MRNKLAAALCALLIVSPCLPPGAFAAPVTVFGSLTITDDMGNPLTGEPFVGVVVMSNPGFEKTVAVRIPPYTFQFFVSAGNNLNTTIAITNISGSDKTIKLNARQLNGDPITLTTDTFMVNNNATLVISLLDFLP